MKQRITTLLILITFTAFAQDKTNMIIYNQLTEVKGTEYVIASIEHKVKVSKPMGKYLLFINTQDGSTQKVDFPAEGRIGQIKQVKNGTLGINKIIVLATTVDLDGKRGIDWSDPQQLFVLSADGKEKKQLTADNFDCRTWTVNAQTGTIIISGHVDTNNNAKFDKGDKSEILIFDLKSLELVSRI